MHYLLAFLSGVLLGEGARRVRRYQEIQRLEEQFRMESNRE
jgi:hypothetical protein